MPNDTLPDWEQVLAAAHRLSTNADHILTDLRPRFDQALAELEAVAGWKTARVKRPVLILGSLDGIETGVRQLIRNEPLATVRIDYQGEKITIPTEAEMLRIKGVLILKRSATRDYLDFVALAEHLGAEKIVKALYPFDRLYPQPNEESALHQLQIQLAQPLPYDLEELNLAEYKRLDPRFRKYSEDHRRSSANT